MLTPEDLKQIEIHFGLPIPKGLPVLDGRVTEDMMVWWRMEDGPLRVRAKEHWINIGNYPEAYQLAMPTIKYID